MNIHQTGLRKHTSLTLQDLPPGGFDEALGVLLVLLEGDVFGEVAEAKEAAGYGAGVKEAKKQRGYDAYRLLAQGITFRTHTALLLSLVGVADGFPDLRCEPNPRASSFLASVVDATQRLKQQRSYNTQASDGGDHLAFILPAQP